MVVADKLTASPKSLSQGTVFYWSVETLFVIFFMYQNEKKEERLQISVWGAQWSSFYAFNTHSTWTISE
jgi:hypothetical protein